MWKSKWKGWLLIILVLVFAAWSLWDFRIVEPEKRSYPMVIGLDWQDGQYQIYLVSESLSESTGQGKTGDEEQEGQESGMFLLQGKNETEIEKQYASQQELYLDIGHVRAIVFGPGLLGDEERYKTVLRRMEQDTALGNSAYVFRTDDMGAVLETNGREVESLGAFLAGIYENRTTPDGSWTLARLYNQLHKQGGLWALPTVSRTEQGLEVRQQGQ